MGEEQLPRGVKALDIIVGLTTLLAAFLIIIGHELGRFALVFALSTSLLGIGVARITRATVLKGKGTYRRGVNLFSGIVVAILAFTVILFPTMSEVQEIELLSLAWLSLGIARILIGILEEVLEYNMQDQDL